MTMTDSQVPPTTSIPIESCRTDDYLDLLPMFVAEAQRALIELGAALDAGEIEEARRIAHRIKGSAATYGYVDLSARMAALEDRMRAGESIPTGAGAKLGDWSVALEKGLLELGLAPLVR